MFGGSAPVIYIHFHYYPSGKMAHYLQMSVRQSNRGRKSILINPMSQILNQRNILSADLQIQSKVYWDVLKYRTSSSTLNYCDLD